MYRTGLIVLGLLAGSGSVAADNHRSAELQNLLLHDCGSCHGMTLQGGLGPSLKPEALADKSDDYLRYTILYGRPGVPMPPWRDILSDADVSWLVRALRKGAFHD